MNPFRRRKPRADAASEEWAERWRKLDERFSRLEKAMDGLKAGAAQVTIENVHIHQPVLEKLEFRLDGLDIEHLSGSLNLGNNFGTKPAADGKISPPKPEPQEKSREPGLHRTPSGFRMNNRR